MENDGGGRTLLGWVCIGASFLLVVVAVALFGVGLGTDSGSADELQESLLLREQSTLEVASVETVALRLLDAAALEGDRSERLAAAATRVSESSAAIAELAATDQLAASTRSLIDVDAVADPVGGDLDELFVVADDLRWTVPAERLTPEHTALHQLAFLAALPWHIAVEATAGIGDAEQVDFVGDAAPFASSMVEVVRTDGGWLEPEASDVLSGSVWFDVTAARQYFPEETARIGSALAASRLVEVDHWILDLSPEIPPPATLAEVERATFELAAIIGPIVDEAIDANVLVTDRAAGAAARDDRMLVALAGAALALAVVAFVGGALLIVRAHRWSRRRAALATRDALTGVANRYELDAGPAAMVDDPEFIEHLAAVVDLDRFKMINDLNGHAAGDAVLVEVARRLVAVATQVASHADAEHRVIRLGGDEFLVLVHGRRPIDVAALRRLLEAARTTPVALGDTALTPEFSVGIVVHRGPTTVDQLMRDADLSAYEDKAERRARRLRATALPAPAPLSAPAEIPVPSSAGGSRI